MRRALIAIVVLAAVVAAALYRCTGAPDRGSPPPRAALDEPGAGTDGGARPRPRAAPRDPADEGEATATRDEAQESRGEHAARRKMIMAFVLCPNVPATLCAQLPALDSACIVENDAVACAAAVALLSTPPRMPDEAMKYLARGCKLGDAAACARSKELHGWWQSAVNASFAVADGEPVPENTAVTACAAGSAEACWFEAYYGRAEGQPFDHEAGRRACDAGIVRACVEVARMAPDAASALHALEAGCAAGGLPACRTLYGALVGDGTCCAAPVPADPLDRNHCIPCGAPDPARAAAIAARIAELTGKPFAYRPVPPDDDDDGPEL